MQVKCPYCEKEVSKKGIAGHIKLAHPKEFAQEGYKVFKENSRSTILREYQVKEETGEQLAEPKPKEKPKEKPAALTKEDLLGKHHPKPEEPYTHSCGATLKKGQTHCPQCGEELDWSGT